MNDIARFTIGILIALFVGILILIPAIYFRTKRFTKKGKSFKHLPIKMVMTIGVPIISIPILLSNTFWTWKIVIIIVIAFGGISNMIGI